MSEIGCIFINLNVMEDEFTAPAYMSDFHSCTTLKHICNSSMKIELTLELFTVSLSTKDLPLHNTEYL